MCLQDIEVFCLKIFLYAVEPRHIILLRKSSEEDYILDKTHKIVIWSGLLDVYLMQMWKSLVIMLMIDINVHQTREGYIFGFLWLKIYLKTLYIIYKDLP